ncbi:MAG: diguanylate cyclase [Eubacteriaceae bacterium]|jgi:diguanylate cyclase (GGDEF)-like protein|nr:diguanylate cyclase [Eubacteriaceae bacterium]
MQDYINVKAFFDKYIKEYAENRDPDSINQYYSDDIFFNGTGANERTIGREDTIALIRKESIVDPYHYSVEQHNIDIKQLCGQLYYLVGYYDIIRFFQEDIEVRMPTVISAVIREAEGEFSIIAIHSQIPATNQDSEEFYPVRFSEEISKEQAMLRESIRKDPMTGVYNKVTAEALIQQILENQHSNTLHALMIIDIDNFKKVNDERGHLIGDQMLIKIAEIIERNFRKQDIVARVGGDEFIIFMQSAGSIDMIAQKAESVCDIFRDNLDRVTCSVGIAVTDTDDSNYRKIFKEADAALYDAKSRGRNMHVFYSGQVFPADK